MNEYVADLLNDDSFKRESLSIESLDKMMWIDELSMDDISLEGDLYGAIKLVKGKINTFFKRIFTFIKDFLNVTKRLERFWDSDLEKDLQKSLSGFDKSVKDMPYEKISDMEIPVSLGFQTKVNPILETMLKDAPSYITEYSKFITNVDNKLSEFITMASERSSFTEVSVDTKFSKLVKDTDDSIMKRLSRTKGSSATIDEVYGSIDSIKVAIQTSLDIKKKMPEKIFRDNVNSINMLKNKIEALYDLIEIERVAVSKASLKLMIDLLRLLADATTVLGKIGLVLFEAGTMNVKTAIVLTKIDG